MNAHSAEQVAERVSAVTLFSPAVRNWVKNSISATNLNFDSPVSSFQFLQFRSTPRNPNSPGNTSNYQTIKLSRCPYLEPRTNKIPRASGAAAAAAASSSSGAAGGRAQGAGERCGGYTLSHGSSTLAPRAGCRTTPPLPPPAGRLLCTSARPNPPRQRLPP